MKLFYISIRVDKKCMTIKTCKERFILLIVLVLTAGWILDSSVNLAYSQTIGGVDLSKIPGLQNLTGFNNVPTTDNGQGTGEGQGTNNVPTTDNGQGTGEGQVQIMYLQRIMDRGTGEGQGGRQMMYLHWTMLLMNQIPIK